MLSTLLKTPLSQTARLARLAPSIRSISTSPSLHSGTHPLSPEPAKTPNAPATTQGHAVDKTVRKDVQSQYVKEGLENRREAEKSGEGEGEAQPFDAARMDGGEPKAAEGKGPFKDQIGGQMGGEQGGGTMGGTESVPEETTAAKFQKALGLKSSRHFSTSARTSLPAPGGSGNDIPGARSPKESSSDLHGDQNAHLTHSKTEGKDNADRKGNAAAEPHLPSKSAPKGSKGFHSSARVSVEDAKYSGMKDSEPKKAGYNAPPSPLPPTLKSAYAPEATPPADPNLKPSSDAEYSSTAQDPPNDVLRKKVLEGGMEEKNPQPNAEVGKIGLDEAWKKRKA